MSPSPIAVLFVCTANRYRSPIAEAAFRAELARRGPQDGWEVSSAGTWTGDGLPAMPDAVLKASRCGLDVSAHRSRAITAEIMRASDLVLVMEHGHREALQVEFHPERSKIALLAEVCSETAYEIPDPVMGSTNADVTALICELIQTGFDHICARALENARWRDRGVSPG